MPSDPVAVAQAAHADGVRQMFPDLFDVEPADFVDADDVVAGQQDRQAVREGFDCLSHLAAFYGCASEKEKKKKE